uniref:Uncharacterized protein n=1 Tax=Romanomermis culicivorax TaxID=13658 RepID=A0A915L1E1_ROMCU
MKGIIGKNKADVIRITALKAQIDRNNRIKTHFYVIDSVYILLNREKPEHLAVLVCSVTAFSGHHRPNIAQPALFLKTMIWQVWETFNLCRERRVAELRPHGERMISFLNLVKLYFNFEEWPLLIIPLLYGIFLLFRRLMNETQYVTIVLKKLARSGQDKHGFWHSGLEKHLATHRSINKKYLDEQKSAEKIFEFLKMSASKRCTFAGHKTARSRQIDGELLTQTQALRDKIKCMKEYEDASTYTSLRNSSNPSLSLSQLIANNLRQENQQIKLLQNENMELKVALQQHQTALDLIMTKYRSKVFELLRNDDSELCNKYSTLTADSAEHSEEFSNMARLVSVVNNCLKLGEQASHQDQFNLARLRGENYTLRHLLKLAAQNDNAAILEFIEFLNNQNTYEFSYENYLSSNSPNGSNDDQHTPTRESVNSQSLDECDVNKDN